jgi:tryptophan synthase beta chain
MAPAPEVLKMRPDPTGRFGGVYGGRYVPETLIVALDELTAAYEEAMKDPAFLVSTSLVQARHAPPPRGFSMSMPQLCAQEEFERLLKQYVGRPSPLYHAERLSEHYRRCGGVRLALHPACCLRRRRDGQLKISGVRDEADQKFVT